MVFFVSPKLLHLLGAERFGVLMIALVTPLIAAQLDLGITSAAVRRFATQMSTGTVDAGTTLFTLFVCLVSDRFGPRSRDLDAGPSIERRARFHGHARTGRFHGTRQGLRNMDNGYPGHSGTGARRSGRTGTGTDLGRADHDDGDSLGRCLVNASAGDVSGQCRRPRRWTDDRGARGNAGGGP